MSKTILAADRIKFPEFNKYLSGIRTYIQEISNYPNEDNALDDSTTNAIIKHVNLLTKKIQNNNGAIAEDLSKIINMANNLVEVDYLFNDRTKLAQLVLLFSNELANRNIDDISNRQLGHCIKSFSNYKRHYNERENLDIGKRLGDIISFTCKRLPEKLESLKNWRPLIFRIILTSIWVYESHFDIPTRSNLGISIATLVNAINNRKLLADFGTSNLTAIAIRTGQLAHFVSSTQIGNLIDFVLLATDIVLTATPPPSNNKKKLLARSIEFLQGSCSPDKQYRQGNCLRN